MLEWSLKRSRTLILTDDATIYFLNSYLLKVVSYSLVGGCVIFLVEHREPSLLRDLRRHTLSHEAPPFFDDPLEDAVLVSSEDEVVDRRVDEERVLVILVEVGARRVAATGDRRLV